jgi:F-box-like
MTCQVQIKYTGVTFSSRNSLVSTYINLSASPGEFVLIIAFAFQLALHVLSFLEPADLLRAAQTCRYWRLLTEDNLLWREKCKAAGIDAPFVSLAIQLINYTTRQAAAMLTSNLLFSDFIILEENHFLHTLLSVFPFVTWSRQFG